VAIYAIPRAPTCPSPLYSVVLWHVAERAAAAPLRSGAADSLTEAMRHASSSCCSPPGRTAWARDERPPEEARQRMEHHSRKSTAGPALRRRDARRLSALRLARRVATYFEGELDQWSCCWSPTSSRPGSRPSAPVTTTCAGPPRPRASAWTRPARCSTSCGLRRGQRRSALADGAVAAHRARGPPPPDEIALPQ
jgi:hypothetical protein